jgi:serine-type D-Ala-D-Ala carboxypeptidase/endopeptidase (penicillin-binding protein 4)
MCRLFKIIFIIFILAFPNISYAKQRSKPIVKNNSTLYREVKSLLRKYGAKDLNAGIYIKNLKDNSVKFSYHPQRFFKPASIVKIFTAYEALTYLDPNYKFETSILSDEETSKDGVIKSDLYIKFSGDPTFTYQDLKNMFEAVDAKEIDGNIIVDGSMFDENHAAPGGFTWDDHPFYYAAPSSAIIINKNTSEAKMSPAFNTGEKANLFINDPTLLKIKNNVLTVLPRKQPCPYKSKYLGENEYEVYGCMFKNKRGGVKLNFSLQNNKLMAQDYIEKVLNELEIKLNGKIEFATAASDLSIIHTHQSPALNKILKDTLEESCNLSASSIFKHITAKYTKQQASDESGELVMKDLLKDAGVKDFFIVKDGAGESRYNLVTPQGVVHLLELAYKNPKLKNVFIDSLAKYGTEGTLKFRNLGKKFNKYTYGKSGTTKTTSAIAGYYLPPHGPKYVFTIMINNHTLSWEKIKFLEDKILRVLLKSTYSQQKKEEKR